MAASTTKKAVVRRFDKESLAGYVNPASYQQPAGIELLTVEGGLATVPYGEIRTVTFVRDFDSSGEPERRAFNTRPKMEGLWVRLSFRDGDVLEGVMPNNLMNLEPHGFTVIPPDPYSAQQRVFVPKAALRSIEVLGVVGSPLTRRKAKPAAREQIGLFDDQTQS